MKKYLKISIISCLLMLSFLSLNQSVFAQTGEPTSLSDRLNKPAELVQGSAGLSDVSLGYIVASVIRAALALLGLIFLIIIVFAGYRWMTASGNEESVQKAQSSIKRAIIGLVIVILAYAITSFVFKQLPLSINSGQGPMGSNNEI